MAGTVTITRRFGHPGGKSFGLEEVKISWTGDATDGSVPNTTLELSGTIERVVTNPGSTAPTANYDIVIEDQDGIDVMQGALANRHTSNSEEVIPTKAGSAASTFSKITVHGTHTFKLTNNSVASATGTVIIYMR